MCIKGNEEEISMKKLLKGLSVLQIVLGILCAVIGIASLMAGNLMSSAVKLPAEQQALTALKVSAVLGLFSAVFNFGCGYFGFKGAGGDWDKLSVAVKLGWVGLIAAIVSAALSLVGDAGIDRITTAVCSSVVPVLFLVSARSVKNDSDGR